MSRQDEDIVIKPLLQIRPDKTVLYKVLQENLLTFLAWIEERNVWLPASVERELRAFLDRGIPAPADGQGLLGLLSRAWPGWERVLVFVQPATVAVTDPS